jgi:hypothetical protein
MYLRQTVWGVNGWWNGKNGFLIEKVSPAGIAAAILEARSRLPLRSMMVPDYTLNDLGAALGELAKGAER